MAIEGSAGQVTVQTHNQAMKLGASATHSALVAQQPHAASGEIHKVHAPHRPANIGISDYAPKVRRAVADAER